MNIIDKIKSFVSSELGKELDDYAKEHESLLATKALVASYHEISSIQAGSSHIDSEGYHKCNTCHGRYGKHGSFKDIVHDHWCTKAVLDKIVKEEKQANKVDKIAEAKSVKISPAATEGKKDEDVDVHPETRALVEDFSAALLWKLAQAEKKYNYTVEWKNPGLIEHMREELARHVDKGDPRDVAAYCVFLWHHKALTSIRNRIELRNRANGCDGVYSVTRVRGGVTEHWNILRGWAGFGTGFVFGDKGGLELKGDGDDLSYVDNKKVDHMKFKLSEAMSLLADLSPEKVVGK